MPYTMSSVTSSNIPAKCISCDKRVQISTRVEEISDDGHFRAYVCNACVIKAIKKLVSS